jgi:peptide-methionine (S)-S-oxide reductase
MTTNDRVQRLETATLGGGCFWCLEAVFERLEGVEKVVSGYTGGRVPEPSYELVCSGLTGHAEVVQITFDPSVLPYRELLEIFFAFHDPTTLNRQGNDVGTQYRSAIYYHSPEQERTARAVIEQLQRDGTWDDAIVTEVTPLDRFYPAEEYHQQYFQRNPTRMYCQAVVAPKVAKLRREYAARLREPVIPKERSE